ncbi:MAG: hypothetical protein VX641_04190 [Planctomycetota bacterium]|nr:hypothetical protein [Planctomycetota bacterium]
MPAFLVSIVLLVQSAPNQGSAESPPVPDGMPEDLIELLDEGCSLLLGVQEGLEDAEWPYQGVYRVRAQPSDPPALVEGRSAIPIGYRVGGTAICAQAIFQTPGHSVRAGASSAVRRAVEFVCASTEDPRMSPSTYEGGYDVRGWGYIYGLRMLLALRSEDCVPSGLEATVEETIRWYIRALEVTAIPEVGGWNYARRGPKDRPSPTSPFMSAPALLALFAARVDGFEVDSAIVDRALTGLQGCVAPDGYVAYAAKGPTADDPGQIPGAIGRMVSAERALLLGGRGSVERVGAAVEAFLENWRALEARRRKTGTHMPPYGVAPYYFYYGFAEAAGAIELLPPGERPGFRERLAAILMQVREPDGSWNDRVFERSRAYGTAMTMQAFQAPWLAEAPSWSPPPGDVPDARKDQSISEPAASPAPDPPGSSP